VKTPPNNERVPRVLITAGPTHEPIDRVRFIGNRSSGRMGIALAAASAKRGWPTTLLLGPVGLPPPEYSSLKVLRFQTTDDLHGLLADHWPSHDLLFMAAAVADYRVGKVHKSTSPQVEKGQQESGKLRREPGGLSLDLVPTPDLLAEVAKTTRPDQKVVGWALEPADRLMESARDKLARKGLHAIVANPLETMDSPTISATVLLRNGQELTPTADLPKATFAEWLLDQVPVLMAAR